MNFWDVLILSFVEGITEFLPISSTGHLIITSEILNLNQDPFVQAFNIIIQFGAICAVLVLYWRRFLSDWGFYKKLFIAFLPAAIIGFLFKKKIEMLLESVQVVAWALIIGGIALLLIEKLYKKQSINRIGTLTITNCVSIGLFQCLAMIPGTSRSAATIIGGLFQKLSPLEAAEFSFFLAVPTLLGATVIKIKDAIPYLDSSHLMQLSMGLLFSFIFALLAIKTFINLVVRSGFKWFAIYRIILGIGILIWKF